MLRYLRTNLIRRLDDAELLDQALQVRNRIRGLRARFGGVIGTELAQRRFADELQADRRLRIAPTRFGHQLARRRHRRTVVDIMQANRALVVGLLEDHGTPYSMMPVDSKNRFRVAVPVAHVGDTLRRLGQLGPAFYVYLDEGSIPLRRRLVSCASLARSPRLRRRARKSPVWRVFQHYIDDAGHAMGDLYGCEIEFWDRDAERGHLHAARWNRLVDTIPEKRFGKERVEVGGQSFSVTGDTYLHRDAETAAFPVDIVYTWVDGSDPEWLERRAETFRQLDLTQRNEDATSRARYESHDELRYSLRSVEQYADFVRHIYIVTDDQRPDWLVGCHPGLTVVDHRDILEPDVLPTFNSHAIESRLHRIDGLSEHYVYMNDDFFFGRRVGVDRFFHSNGLAKFFLSRAHIPLGDATVSTKPVDAAAMNGRQLVWDEFGFMPRRKFKHTPYSQRRTVHEELERRFPEAVARTTASRVRSPTDLAMASSLHHYVAYGLGLAVPGPIDSRYVDLGEPNLEGRLWDLRQDRNYDVLCLNDNDGAELSPEQQGRMATELLEALFPIASKFEIRKDAP